MTETNSRADARGGPALSGLLFPEFALEGQAIARRLPEPDICNVEHPDAEGPCRKPAPYEVYGRSYCEAHGMEAAHVAVGAFDSEVVNVRCGIDALVGHGFSLRSPFGWVVQTADKRPPKTDQEAALIAAYPLAEARVDIYTRQYYEELEAGEETAIPPCDYWQDSLNALAPALREAQYWQNADALHDLDYLRQRYSAQLAFALQLEDRRLRAPEERQSDQGEGGLPERGEVC
jgi:hypothetical protein